MKYEQTITVNNKEIQVWSAESQNEKWSGIDSQFYNKPDGLIAEVLNYDNEYVVEYFKLGSGGQYHKQLKTTRTTNLASACVYARSWAAQIN